jgi:hypothetical protein
MRQDTPASSSSNKTFFEPLTKQHSPNYRERSVLIDSPIITLATNHRQWARFMELPIGGCGTSFAYRIDRVHPVVHQADPKSAKFLRKIGLKVGA